MSDTMKYNAHLFKDAIVIAATYEKAVEMYKGKRETFEYLKKVQNLKSDEDKTVEDMYLGVVTKNNNQYKINFSFYLDSDEIKEVKYISEHFNVPKENIGYSSKIAMTSYEMVKMYNDLYKDEKDFYAIFYVPTRV